jgi:Zn-dependent protease
LFLLKAVLTYLVLLGSVVFHEFSHAWMAKRLGDDNPLLLERLTLNPKPHIDILGTLILPLSMLLFRTPYLFGWAKPVPINHFNLRNPKKDMLLIGASGPVTNFLLAFFFTFLLKTGIFPHGSLAEAFIALVVLLNLVLGTFNLIPLAPLDGSHILFGLLPKEAETKYIRLQPFMPFILILLVFTGFLGYIIFPIFYLWTNIFNLNFVNPAMILLRG